MDFVLEEVRIEGNPKCSFIYPQCSFLQQAYLVGILESLPANGGTIFLGYR